MKIGKKWETFHTSGIVLGNHWGGGTGGYATVTFGRNTIEEIDEHTQKLLKDGSLDSGMGFESLIGGVMDIEKTSHVMLDDVEYITNSFETEFYGEATLEQQTMMLDWIME